MKILTCDGTISEIKKETVAETNEEVISKLDMSINYHIALTSHERGCLFHENLSN